MREQRKHHNEQNIHITREQVIAVGGTLLTSGIIDVATHFNPAYTLAGLVAIYAAGRLTPEIVKILVPSSDPEATMKTVARIVDHLDREPPEEERPQDVLSKLKRLFHIKSAHERLVDQEDDELEKELSEEASLFVQRQQQKETNAVRRLTIDEICAHIEYNSYKIFIGRSLTSENNHAVLMSIYKRHFRFMGASQMGKSSMVAAFLEIVTRTHDAKHVRLALLDKEDQTSWLFAHLPHVATISSGGERMKLHARNSDQVLEYLIHCVAIMEYRLTLLKAQILNMPVLLVYVEEFLKLKNEFKVRIAQARIKEAREQAQSDYATLVYCIGAIAQQGLKARVQLLLCAQVEYADDDFRDAMPNITCGFAFCIRPTAAASAGFLNTELIRRNAKENKVGRAVVETPDCTDLVLAPDYDLEARLLAFERAHPEIHHSPDESVIERTRMLENAVKVNGEYMVNEPEKLVNASVNDREYSPGPVNHSPTFTQAEETQVLLAYAEILKSGRPVTRTGIRDYLGWNSKHYERIIKPVCDKYHIG